MVHQKISLNSLWQPAPLSKQSFQPVEQLGLPDPVRRYLQHAISLEGDAATSKTPLATAVRLKMHGEIRLKGWQSFRAELALLKKRPRLTYLSTRQGDYRKPAFNAGEILKRQALTMKILA